MKQEGVGYEAEFEDLIGSLAQTTSQVSDPVAIGAMLYSIAEERKNTNLIIRNLNAKIDSLLSKFEQIERNKEAISQTAGLSERDLEVIEFVRGAGRISAEELQVKFNYKGKNAASARLSKLFHEGMLEKEFAGRKVYYKLRV